METPIANGEVRSISGAAANAAATRVFAMTMLALTEQGFKVIQDAVEQAMWLSGHITTPPSEAE